ncbi:MAG: hypothetical protein EXR67_06585 [Dehalococcoidia bacterium]|nr:hypothetical protein [Dehalococcoidia bacterium]
MQKNPLKEKLHNGQPVLGLFMNLPSPALVEIMGYTGFDFVIVDGEHAISDLETCEHMFRAAETSGITPLVRIALNHPQNILRYLDAGAMGVQIPMVNTRADAESVVASVLYPPRGRRGLAGVRANRYGAQPLADYVEMANREMLCIVQVETVQAVQNAKDIAGVDGIDMVFIGPTDLSTSMGYIGQPEHPAVLKAIAEVGRIVMAAGKSVGTIARDANAYEHWRKLGFQYLASGLTSFVQAGARAYRDMSLEREATLIKQSSIPHIHSN